MVRLVHTATERGSVNMDALNTMARERAVDKIRKLLAVARDGRGNEHEAANAASAAEKLMRHYQIESADVVMDELTKDEAFERGMENVSFEGIAGHKPKQTPPWVGYIAVGCGEAFTCKVDLVSTIEGVKVRFSGYAMDVMLCRWVYSFLCQEVFRISKEHCKGRGMSASKSFRLGAASVLQARLKEMKATRTKEAEQSAAVGSSTALVLYDKKESRVEEMFGATKTQQKKHTASDAGAYWAGREQAAKMAIPTNRPLSGASNYQRLSA